MAAGWAREWLDEVRAASYAVMLDDRIMERRRDAAYSLPGGTGGANGGGSGDPMEKVDALVDAEKASSMLGWARQLVAEFRAAMDAIRAGCKGDVLEASYLAEMRCCDLKDIADICEELAISRATYYRRIEMLIDYLDYIGKESAVRRS